MRETREAFFAEARKGRSEVRFPGSPFFPSGLRSRSMRSHPLRTILLVLVCLIVILFAPRSAAAAPKRLLAYYTSWSKWNSPAYTAANIPYEKLTHIAHA